MKKLSIITINYNNLLGLKRTVSSVLKSINMHSNAVEYIIIDGKSNDGSVLFLKKNRQKFNKLIIEKDDGIYDAINKGIRLAVGEYVLLMNSGDELRNGVLKDVLPKLKKSDIYYGDVNIISKGKKYLYKTDHIQLSHRMSISHQGTFVSSKLYDSQMYDTSFKLSADFAYFNKCLRLKKQFVKLDLVVADFESGGRSDTHFCSSRMENLQALYSERQYLNMFVGFLRYVREAIHLGVKKFVH